MSVDKIYNYYLYNIYTMINTLGFKYRFAGIEEHRYINFNESFASNFNIVSNPYLLDSRESKTTLAKDILTNGMLFPFFGGRLSNQLDPDIYFILQGKHRLFALKSYSSFVEDISDRRFLFIDSPVDIQCFKLRGDRDKLPRPITLFSYLIDIGLYSKEYYTYTAVLELMDRFGGSLGEYIHEARKAGHCIKGNPVLTDMASFGEFIATPFCLEL